MATLFANPRYTPVDAQGDPYPGATLTFYAAGTTTPQPVYTTSALTTPHPSPVTANSAGQFPAIYYDDALQYRAILRDATGVLLWDIDTINSSLTAEEVGRALYPRSAAEISANVTPLNYRRDYGDVRRYGTNTVPGTTDMTAALQAAINANNVIRLPGETMAFTNLTIPVGRVIEGEGPRKSVLLQITGSTGNAMTFGDIVTADISEGGYQFRNFAMRVATGSHGLFMGPINASMFLTDNFRLVSRQAESLTSPPYATTANQRGIYIDNVGGVGALFFHTHRNLEIRSFDIGIDAANIINEHTVHGWILDCRVAVRLTGCSTWDLSGLTVETGVLNARALQTFGAVSNIKWHGGRWELTQTGGYGIEGDGSTTGQNWRFSGINVLITGDGSGIPGRKWTGTIPNDVLFEGTDVNGAFMVHPNANQTLRLPQRVVLGGQNLGNGRITIGRNADSAALNTIEHDGTNLVITGGNSVHLRGDGSTTDRMTVNNTRVSFPSASAALNYVNAIALGTSGFLWIDSTGDLRIKTTAPTSDTDGTVVGTQT